MGGLRIPETGTRCRVLWDDYVGGISEPLSRIVPCACWTEGVVVRVEKNFIVLATSQFIEESKDPSAPNLPKLLSKKNGERLT